MAAKNCGGDRAEAHGVFAIRRVARCRAIEPDGRRRLAADEGRGKHHRRRARPADRPSAASSGRLVEPRLRGAVVARLGQHELLRDDTVGGEADVDALQLQQAGAHDPGRGEQHRRPAPLAPMTRPRRSQWRPPVLVRPPSRSASNDDSARAHPRRRGAEGQADDQRDRSGEKPRRRHRGESPTPAARSPAARRAGPRAPTTRPAGRAVHRPARSTRLSTSSCRTSRPRGAPSAVRTANSRRRPSARASIRPGDVGAGDEEHARRRRRRAAAATAATSPTMVS